MPTVSVLIVTYNSQEYIDACVSSLRVALQGLEAEVIVYDNASTDDTVTRLSQHPEVRTISAQTNAGFAAACNYLAEHSNGRFLFFLNPDTTLEADTVRELLAACDAHPEAGLYGARTVSFDGDIVAASAQGHITVWSLLCFASGLSAILSGAPWANPEGMPGWDRNSSRQVPMVSGGALVVRRDVWTELCGFDTRFFMYAEDADLCARANGAGHHPWFVATATVQHHVGRSSAAGEKVVLLYRGKVTYLRKHWPSWRAALGVRMLLAGIALRAYASRLGVLPERPGRTSGLAWEEAWSRRSEWHDGWAPGRMKPQG